MKRLVLPKQEVLTTRIDQQYATLRALVLRCRCGEVWTPNVNEVLLDSECPKCNRRWGPVIKRPIKTEECGLTKS